jgi:hypothetical protein
MPQVTIDVPQATLDVMHDEALSLEDLLELGLERLDERKAARKQAFISMVVPQDALIFLAELGVTLSEAFEAGVRYIEWKQVLGKFNREDIAVSKKNQSPRVPISLETPQEYVDFLAANDLDLAGTFYRGVVVISEEIPNEETIAAMNSSIDECHVAKDKEDFYKQIGLDKW